MAAVAETISAPVDVEANFDSVVDVDALADKDLNVEKKESKNSESTVTGTATGEGSEIIVRGGTFRSGGTVPSAICLSKAALGAGILSMAAHAADVGFTYQVVALVVGALLTLVSIRMIADASVSTKRWSYEDICEELFHPGMSFLTGIINVCNCVGAGAAYLIVCGQVFQVVSGCDEHVRKLFVAAMGVFVCGPLALAEHVGFMRHLAAVSVFALLLLVLVVIWFYGKHGPDESVTQENFFVGPGGATTFTYMNAINNIVFAYNNQFNVPQLTGELKPAASVSRMSRVSLLSTGISFSLYTGVSIFGVLAFGVGENQRDSFILDLYPERSNPLVLAALLAVMFSVLTCFQFHIFPIRQFSTFAVRKIRGRAAEDEKTDRMYRGRSLTRWFDMASALLAVFVIVLIAVAISTLRTILDFIGAFASAYISYVVPPLWLIQVRRRQPGFTWCSLEILGCMAFFALGIFLFVFGTYAAIRDF
jgi:amino acid permease